MRVEFENKTKHHLVPQKFAQLMRCGADVLRLPKETKVNLFFVDPAEIRGLNKRTRKINKVTDVLSFPLQEEKDYQKDVEGNVALGDIVINPDYSLKKAKTEGRKESDELFFLAVHGLLHLCGYDHNSDSGQVAMEKASKKILNNFLKNDSPA